MGAHISRLVEGAKSLGAWRTDPAKLAPGDVFMIATPPKGEDAHVGFFLKREGDWLHTADAGQRAEKTGAQAARRVRRRLVKGKLSGPDGAAPLRPFIGFVDVAAASKARAK
jgi:hypothetical protein